MSDIGIVIVTYNSEAEIGACLDAALRTGAQVVVVDNASGDGSIREVARRGVRLIANSTNRGFAAAVNQGFAVLSCTYVLVLNPDTVIEGGIEALAEACGLPGAAAAGGALLDDDGHFQEGFMVRRLPTPAALICEALLINRIWPGNPVNRRYRALGLDYSKRMEVEQPAGAFLMVRRGVWSELGGLDEGFFPVWFEDVDFCRRIRMCGYRSYYVPEATAKHKGAHSIRHLAVEMRNIYWYRSLLRYSAKHFHSAAFRAVSLAVATGSILRMTTEVALQRNLKPLGTYARVVRLAVRCIWLGWRERPVMSGIAD